MNISLVEMIIISYFSLFLMIVLLADKGASQKECEETRCGENGPPIRFPFRLKDRQPPHCGYPGFDLSCTTSNMTTLELPNILLKLFVTHIYYESQELDAYNPFCIHRQNLKFLNLSISPFQFSSYSGSTLLKCSSNHTGLSSYNFPIPCLSNSRYNVFVYYSAFDTNYYWSDLVSCTKMFDILSVPPEIFTPNNDYVPMLTWSKPNCKYCEAKGKRCRLKRPDAENETECFKVSQPGRGDRLEHSLVTAGLTTGSFIIVLGILATFYVCNSHKKDRENQLRIENFLEDYIAFKPSRYTYADLKNITNQFKDKLGQGAYGTVFKGKLSNDILVAVKILNNSKGNGEEFINEVATMGQIHHVNVVRLVGYCAEGFRRALIYEFLPNDSLEKYISVQPAGAANCSLSWEKLQEIALGTAKGIEYLHQGCDKRILHFDIKPHNILLDHNFKPKISDFGLAKLCSKDQSVVSMTTARGTMGYIAPEVFSRNFGNVSYKSDVYSFGMLLLEMIGGRKNINVTKENAEEIYYPEWIYNLLEEGEDFRIYIDEEGDAKIAKRLAIVGLWCIQWHPIGRPTMKSVVHMLEGKEELSMPPNPFASTGPTIANTKTATRLMTLELEAIAE